MMKESSATQFSSAESIGPPAQAPRPPGKRAGLAAVAVAVGLVFAALSDPFLSPPDTAAYFSWGWSLATDGDFSFTNEFSAFEFPLFCVWVTAAEHVGNDWPMGSGLAWLPAMIPAAWIEAALGLALRDDSPPLLRHWIPGPLVKIAVMTGSAFGAFFVLGWAFLRIRGRFDSVSAGWALGVVIFGTPLFFYLWFGPFFSHVPAFVAAGIVLLSWDRWRGRWNPRRAFTFGIVAGWMMCIRPQTALYLIVVPLGEWLLWLQGRKAIRSGMDAEGSDTAAGEGAGVAAGEDAGEREGHGSSRGPSSGAFSGASGMAGLWGGLAAGGAGGAGLVLGFAPQLLAWWRLHGSPLALPKIEEMHWFNPRVGEMLFSDFHGLLPWTPVLALALPGLYFLCRRDRALGIPLAAAFALQLYVNAANEIWWCGGSFGNRRLVDASLILLWAYAALFWRARMGLPGSTAYSSSARPGPWARWRTRALYAAVALCCAWTLWLAAMERVGLLTLDHYIPFREDFRDALWKLAVSPGRLVERVLAGGQSLGWGYRGLFALLVAGACAASAYLAGWIENGFSAAENRMDSEYTGDIPRAAMGKKSLRLHVGVWVMAGGLALATGLALLRTPTFHPSHVDSRALPRHNAILWSNYLELGHYLLTNFRPEEAFEAFEKAEALRPTDRTARRYQAMALHAQGRWEASARKFDAVLAEAPDDAPAWREAQALCASWIHDQPEAWEPWEWMARYHARRGEHRAAAEFRAKAESLRPPRQQPR